MGGDIIGVEPSFPREGAQHRRQRRRRAAAKGLLRTAATLLQGHHGSSISTPVSNFIGLGMRSAGHGGAGGTWQSPGQTGKGQNDWNCKWCLGPDGQQYRNHSDRKSCRLCNVAKSWAYQHPKAGEVKKPSTSLAERQVLAEKADSRRQLQAQKRRIDHLEKQLQAKVAGGSEEESGPTPAEGVNPSKLASKQQRTQRLLAEAQAEGLLGTLDISSMPWTKVVLPKVVETAESLHKEAKGKYSSAWGRWKRSTMLVDEQRVQVANLEEQLEAAKALLLKNEEDFKLADSALSEAAKLVEVAAAKQRQEMAEKTELPSEKDEEMEPSTAEGKKRAGPGAEEKALLSSFQEELLADVKSGLGEPPTDEAASSFVSKCTALFLNLQKVVAEQRAAAAVAASVAPPVATEPRERARSRSRSPIRQPRSSSCPPTREADCL